MSNTISATTRIAVRNVLRDKLLGGSDGVCFFRRFSGLTSTFEPTKITKLTSPSKAEQVLTSLNGVSSNEFDRYVKTTYKEFYGLTTTQVIRDEPDFLRGASVFVHSDKYAQLSEKTWSLENCSEAVTPNAASSNGAGDLLFIYMSKANLNGWVYGGRRIGELPTADKWCIVSEQFLRAWTAIMFDWHESFKSLVPKSNGDVQREKQLKSKLFSGNRLMTNTWLKTKLSYEDNKQSFTAEKSEEMYWRLRTEKISQEFVDVYAAIVLIARYGELPTSSNVPANAQPTTNCSLVTNLKRKNWSLPCNFVENLGKTCNVEFPKSAKQKLFEVDW